MRFLHRLDPPCVHRDLKVLMMLLITASRTNSHSRLAVVKSACVGGLACQGGRLWFVLHISPLKRTLRTLILPLGTARLMQYICDVHPGPLNGSTHSTSISHHVSTSNISSQSRTMTKGVGTLLWTAPEVLSGKAYGQPADVYRSECAIIVCFMMNASFDIAVSRLCCGSSRPGSCRMVCVKSSL